jgi:hypothetical protein
MLKSIFQIMNIGYPASFRDQFYEEMLADLEDLNEDLQQLSFWQRTKIIKREVSGWIVSILRENINLIKTKITLWLHSSPNLEAVMNEMKNKSALWRIDDNREAIIASLPPLLVGLSVWLTWTVIGGPWHTATETQLKTGLFSGLIVAALVAIGGIIALLKHYPTWGYSWLGTDIFGVLLLVKSLAEESPVFLPEWLIYIIALALLVFCTIVFIHAVLESWQAAGLISIGMSTIMALSNVHLMAVGPYHRVDLAILGLVFGTVFSILTFFFTRTRQLWQAVLLACIGLLNIGVLFIANQVWAPNMAASGKSTPLVPMLVIVLILLLSGPVLGLFRRPVKTIFGKFIK